MLEKIDIQNLLDFNPDDAVAVHGTSVEAVKILLKTGVLPSSEKRWRDCHPEHLEDYKEGCLYLVPNKAKLERFLFYKKLYDFDEIHDDAVLYAHLIASRHYIASNIGFEPVDDPAFYLDASGWYYPSEEGEKPPLLIEAEEHGMTETDFRKFLDDAWDKTKGILVYMSPKFLNLPIGYECEAEISVYAPNGLALRNILGIKPLGDYESGVLEKIVS